MTSDGTEVCNKNVIIQIPCQYHSFYIFAFEMQNECVFLCIHFPQTLRTIYFAHKNMTHK